MLPQPADEVFSFSVEPLSNLRSRRNVVTGDGEGVVLRPAQRREIHNALQLVLSQGGQLAGEEQVVDFLRFAVYRSIDMNSMWVAAENGRIVWAILPVVSPGRTMLLFSPSHVPKNARTMIVCPLVERVIEHYQGRAIDLAQVLIDPAEKAAVAVYEDCQFERMAELVYLDREVHRAHDTPVPKGYSWDVYSSATHDEFARTISATYELSLDCPMLNGRRQIEDVIAGHKAAGEFDPKLWFVLRDNYRTVGVLLLNRSSRTDSLELVYLGLIPPARGRGLGDLMMTHALATADAIGARRLSLAVDSKNEPALRLYRRHGLSQICSRLALIRDLRQQSAQCARPVSTP